MPFGSGMGTFVPVYAMFERPGDVLANVYANRAHNDLLELWLESGVLGIALMGIFAAWFIAVSLKIWRRSPEGAGTIDASLARAATLIILLLVAHSFVDYPLRTGAMMAIMAFACALLIVPPPTPQGEVPARAEALPFSDAGLSRQQVYEQQLRPVWPALDQQASDAKGQRPGERWGKDIEWPEEWRKPTDPGGPGKAGR
jgi:hypothetical protein